MNTFTLFISQSKSKYAASQPKNVEYPLLSTNLRRYIFNPGIDGYIDNKKATLDLATCCIWYLCQTHHDAWNSNEEVAANIISGGYRLHEYAVTMWLELVKRYVGLNGSKTLPSVLIQALEGLAADRSNNEFESSTDLADQFHEPNLENFKDQWPELHTMLCESARFRSRYSSSEYHMSKREFVRLPRNLFPSKFSIGNLWTALDPLTICHISVSIYMQLDRLLCTTMTHANGCNCSLLERHYGRRRYKCDILGCLFRRHGFTTRYLRDSHIRHHERPWKCIIQSCEYAEIGFLSRRMRDEHLDSNHQEAKPQAELLPINSDIDEIQPLFFDLIRLDKVQAVKSIQHHFNKLAYSVRLELIKLIGFSGSVSMAQVMRDWICAESFQFWTASIEGMNLETCRWTLSHLDLQKELNFEVHESLLKALVESGSLEIFRECEKQIINILGTKRYIRLSIAPRVLQATAGYLDREHHLCSIWAGLNTTTRLSFRSILGSALANVAKTTCSLGLAKTLLECGAEINFRRSHHYLTPLHYAARQSSPQAAELVRFLLYHGADPELDSSRSKSKIVDEKGAKNIAKWLDMSWDELIQKIKLDRERGFCPPEYM